MHCNHCKDWTIWNIFFKNSYAKGVDCSYFLSDSTIKYSRLVQDIFSLVSKIDSKNKCLVIAIFPWKASSVLNRQWGITFYAAYRNCHLRPSKTHFNSKDFKNISNCFNLEYIQGPRLIHNVPPQKKRNYTAHHWNCRR